MPLDDRWLATRTQDPAVQAVAAAVAGGSGHRWGLDQGHDKMLWYVAATAVEQRHTVDEAVVFFRQMGGRSLPCQRCGGNLRWDVDKGVVCDRCAMQAFETWQVGVAVDPASLECAAPLGPDRVCGLPVEVTLSGTVCANGHGDAPTRPKGRPTDHAESQHVTRGEPPEPLRATTRGTAMAAAGVALEALTGRPHRLLWCVSLEREVGVPDATVDDGYADGRWGATLRRLRDALDRQAWGPYSCRFAAAIRQRVGDGEATIVTTIPWRVDLRVLCGRNPSVGVWRLWPLPERENADGTPAGDRLPGSFWRDGVPFAVLIGLAAWHGAVVAGCWV